MVMAIDDNVLTNLLDKLHIKLKEAVEAERAIGQLINALMTIRKNADGSLPIDPLTNNTITEERRTEVFEATINNAIQYVGGED